MCAKREPREVLQPISDLQQELFEENIDFDISGLGWAGTVTFFGCLESI